MCWNFLLRDRFQISILILRELIKQITFSFFFLKIFTIFRVYCNNNTVMIYNNINRSSVTTESKKEKKTCFNARFQFSQSKITGLK